MITAWFEFSMLEGLSNPSIISDTDITDSQHTEGSNSPHSVTLNISEKNCGASFPVGSRRKAFFKTAYDQKANFSLPTGEKRLNEV